MKSHSILFLTAQGKPRVQPDCALQVQRLRWESLGGPAEACLAADGDERSLSLWLPYLGAPVEIYDAHGERTWWGFLAAVQAGAVSYDLRRVFNRIRAAYTYSVDEGGLQVVQRGFTGWVEDATSQKDYGVREKILSVGTAGAAAAQSARDQSIAQYGRLAPQWSKTGQTSPGMISLTCLGWASTLGWRYYTNPGGLEGYTVTGTGVQALGDATGEIKLAQAWQAQTSGWDLDAVWVKAARAGNPGDALVAGLYPDEGGRPGSSLLAGGSLAGSDLSPDYAWVKIPLSPTFNVNAVTYWLVLSRSGSLSAAGYKLKVNESAGYERGVLLLWNGSTWVARAPDADLNFSLPGKRETTAQIAEIVAPSACGAFLNGTFLEVASGLWTCPYRDGSRTGLQELQALLAAGTADGGGLLAEVLPDRRLWIHNRPAEVNLHLGEEGGLYDRYGQAVRADQAINCWVRLPAGDSAFIGQIEEDGQGRLSFKPG